MSAYSQQRQATVPHGGSHLGLCAEADRRHVQEKRTAMVIVNRARDLLLLLMLLTQLNGAFSLKKMWSQGKNRMRKEADFETLARHSIISGAQTCPL